MASEELEWVKKNIIIKIIVIIIIILDDVCHFKIKTFHQSRREKQRGNYEFENWKWKKNPKESHNDLMQYWTVRQLWNIWFDCVSKKKKNSSLSLKLLLLKIFRDDAMEVNGTLRFIKRKLKVLLICTNFSASDVSIDKNFEWIFFSFLLFCWFNLLFDSMFLHNQNQIWFQICI